MVWKMKLGKKNFRVGGVKVVPFLFLVSLYITS